MKYIQIDSYGRPVAYMEMFGPEGEGFVQEGYVAALPDMTPGNYAEFAYDIPAGMFSRVGQTPSFFHVWDFALSDWRDTRTLQQHKDAKRAEIKQARDVAICQPVNTPYGVVDATEASYTAVTRAVLMMQTAERHGVGELINFTLANNSVVRLDTNQVEVIGLLLGKHLQAVRDTAQSLYERIEASVTSAEVEAIAWESEPAPAAQL